MPDPVVPSGINTLAAPARRLPLGIPTDCPSGSVRWFVWIPSNIGGELKIELDGASSIEIQAVSGAVLASGSTEASYHVPMGVSGDLVVVTTGGAGSPVHAHFTQTYWARQSASLSAAPLVPNNFWYWPSKGSEGWALRANNVLRRYGEAVGKAKPDPAVFEHAMHQDDDAEAWEGHCHNAAPVSAMIEPPEKGTIGSTLGFGGRSFDADEIKLLATELFGNYGSTLSKWHLQRGAFDGVGRFSLLAYLKPGGPKTLAALAAALVNTVGREQADQFAGRAIALEWGEAPFAEKFERELGVQGAGFFKALQTQIAQEGQPLMGNLRGYDAHRGPEEVWNQVCFHFSASYIETAGLNDPCDLLVLCNLTANTDKAPPTSEPPARVKAGTVYPSKPGQSSLSYLHRLRLVFLRNGSLDETSAKNRWLSVKNHVGEQLYAPINLAIINKLDTKRRAAKDAEDESLLGNPVVGLELLKELTLHPRFR
jgi:hypothetical protein